MNRPARLSDSKFQSSAILEASLKIWMVFAKRAVVEKEGKTSLKRGLIKCYEPCYIDKKR